METPAEQYRYHILQKMAPKLLRQIKSIQRIFFSNAYNKTNDDVSPGLSHSWEPTLIGQYLPSVPLTLNNADPPPYETIPTEEERICGNAQYEYPATMSIVMNMIDHAAGDYGPSEAVPVLEIVIHLITVRATASLNLHRKETADDMNFAKNNMIWRISVEV
jgi:hypothetical protein